MLAPDALMYSQYPLKSDSITGIIIPTLPFLIVFTGTGRCIILFFFQFLLILIVLNFEVYIFFM